MTSVFVSYKRADEARALRVVRALEREGLKVWWDQSLPGGESWRAGIEQALEQSDCVVVLWSRNSVGAEGEFVRDEAGHALQRGRLVPVLLDRVLPPLGFREQQAIDLTRWRGRHRDPFFKDLVSAVAAKVEGRPVPPATGPRVRLVRRLLAGSGASLAIVLLSAFGTNAFGAQDRLCAAPGFQPGLSDFCGAIGLGHRPTRVERTAWESRPAGSCQALSAHLAQFPEGAYREQATALLQSRQPDTAAVATPLSRAAAWYVRTGSVGHPTREAAEADARRRAEEEAGQNIAACGPRDGLETFRSVEIGNPRFDCRRLGSGWTCSLDAQLTCHLDRREVGERCGEE